ncbi:MAG: addiction module protein [Verrucomicrobia bacterium]|nr:addiction module protein [Verrucomicrobiota bacterium]
MHLADFPQLKSATPQQKLELIDEIWATIPPEAVATPASHVAELDRRLSALERDSKKTLSPEEARIRIRQRTGL